MSSIEWKNCFESDYYKSFSLIRLIVLCRRRQSETLSGLIIFFSLSRMKRCLFEYMLCRCVKQQSELIKWREIKWKKVARWFQFRLNVFFSFSFAVRLQFLFTLFCASLNFRFLFDFLYFECLRFGLVHSETESLISLKTMRLVGCNCQFSPSNTVWSMGFRIENGWIHSCVKRKKFIHFFFSRAFVSCHSVILLFVCFLCNQNKRFSSFSFRRFRSMNFHSNWTSYVRSLNVVSYLVYLKISNEEIHFFVSLFFFFCRRRRWVFFFLSF